MAEEDLSITVHLKAPTGDTDISCRLSDTVSSLKESVIRQLSAHGKHVRLIFSGKMLDADNSPLSQYGISDGSFVHAVVTTMKGPNQQQQQPSSSPARSAPIVYRGFDRLTQLGLSIDETAALRSSFNPQVNEFVASGNHQARPDEDNSSFRYRMEEQWIASQSSRSEFSMNLPSDRVASARRGALVQQAPPSADARGGFSSLSMSTFNFSGPRDVERQPASPGTMNDFFWGLAMGFGLGILMLFCVWDRNISQKQKLGILTGVFLHIMGGLMQQSYDQQKVGGHVDQALAQNPTEIVFEENMSQ